MIFHTEITIEIMV